MRRASACGSAAGSPRWQRPPQLFKRHEETATKENGMNNRVTLNDIFGLAPSELEALPIDQLAMLMDDLAMENDRLKALKLVINGALSNRFDAPVEPGTSHVQDNGYDVKITVAKRVEWDQDALKSARLMLHEKWGENPDEYVKAKYSVSESAYKSWPSSIRALFEKARLVKASAPSFEIKRMEAA